MRFRVQSSKSKNTRGDCRVEKRLQRLKKQKSNRTEEISTEFRNAFKRNKSPELLRLNAIGTASIRDFKPILQRILQSKVEDKSDLWSFSSQPTWSLILKPFYKSLEFIRFRVQSSKSKKLYKRTWTANYFVPFGETLNSHTFFSSSTIITSIVLICTSTSINAGESLIECPASLQEGFLATPWWERPGKGIIEWVSVLKISKGVAIRIVIRDFKTRL